MGWVRAGEDDRPLGAQLGLESWDKGEALPWGPGSHFTDTWDYRRSVLSSVAQTTSKKRAWPLHQPARVPGGQPHPPCWLEGWAPARPPRCKSSADCSRALPTPPSSPALPDLQSSGCSGPLASRCVNTDLDVGHPQRTQSEGSDRPGSGVPHPSG